MQKNSTNLIFSSSIILLGMALLLPFSLFKDYGRTVDFNLFIVWTIIFISVVRLCISMVTGKRKIIDMTFYVFIFVWFGYIPFVQLITNTFPLAGEYSSSEIRFGLLIILIGIISYEIGKKFNKKNNDSKVTVPSKSQWTPNLKMFYITSIISILITSIIVLSIGGISSLFISRQALSNFAGNGDKTSLLITTTLLRVPVFASLLLGVFCIKQTTNRNSTLNLTVFTLFIVNFTVTNLVSSPRYWFGAVALTFVFMITKWKKSSFTKWTLSFIVILLFIFPYSDIFRHNTTTANVNYSEILNNVRNESANIAKDGDYDGFQMVLNTVKDTQYNGYSYGKQFLVSALFFIPRSLWHNKPYGTGQTVATHLGYDFTNLSAPLWAEGFHNFGLFGVVLLFFIYGVFVQRIQDIYNSYPKSYMSIFVPFFAAYQFFFLRGEMLSGISYLAFFTIISLIMYRLIGMKERNRNNV